jgi:hypothetical protein
MAAAAAAARKQARKDARKTAASTTTGTSNATAQGKHCSKPKPTTLQENGGIESESSTRKRPTRSCTQQSKVTPSPAAPLDKEPLSPITEEMEENEAEAASDTSDASVPQPHENTVKSFLSFLKDPIGTGDVAVAVGGHSDTASAKMVLNQLKFDGLVVRHSDDEYEVENSESSQSDLEMDDLRYV